MLEGKVFSEGNELPLSLTPRWVSGQGRFLEGEVDLGEESGYPKSVPFRQIACLSAVGTAPAGGVPAASGVMSSLQTSTAAGELRRLG